MLTVGRRQVGSDSEGVQKSVEDGESDGKFLAPLHDAVEPLEALECCHRTRCTEGRSAMHKNRGIRKISGFQQSSLRSAEERPYDQTRQDQQNKGGMTDLNKTKSRGLITPISQDTRPRRR